MNGRAANDSRLGGLEVSPRTAFTITDITLFTGTTTLPWAYVTVTDGLISSFGPMPFPSSAPRPLMPRLGHTLLPGFIDAHIHADKGKVLALTQSLQFGVTTVMDMHNEAANVAKLKAFARENVRESADIKMAGPAATIDGGWPMPVVTAHDKTEETLAEIATWPKLTSPEDAVAFVHENINAVGADYTKLMHESGRALAFPFHLPTPSLAIQESVIKTTQSLGKVAVAHAFAREDTLQLLGLGINGLTHTFLDEPCNDEVVAAYKKAGAWVNPTLALLGSFTKEGMALQQKYAADERVKGKLTELGMENLCQCMGAGKEGTTVQNAYDTIKRLKSEGINVIVGSDSAGPGLGTAWGLSFHHELSLLVNECGFTPAEALHAGTALTAKLFGWNDRGCIAEGLKADLVLVEGNPLEDIDATLNLRGVWRDGVLTKGYNL